MGKFFATVYHNAFKVIQYMVLLIKIKCVFLIDSILLCDEFEGCKSMTLLEIGILFASVLFQFILGFPLCVTSFHRRIC